MDAFERLGTICLIFTCVVLVPIIIRMHTNYLLLGLMVIATAPIMWIAGLNILEFLTKPFSEKGVKGFLSWIISIILGIVVYSAFFAILIFMFKWLML